MGDGAASQKLSCDSTSVRGEKNKEFQRKTTDFRGQWVGGPGGLAENELRLHPQYGVKKKKKEFHRKTKDFRGQ